jgi:hypothetical protein
VTKNHKKIKLNNHFNDGYINCSYCNEGNRYPSGNDTTNAELREIALRIPRRKTLNTTKSRIRRMFHADITCEKRMDASVEKCAGAQITGKRRQNIFELSPAFCTSVTRHQTMTLHHIEP